MKPRHLFAWRPDLGAEQLLLVDSTEVRAWLDRAGWRVELAVVASGPLAVVVGGLVGLAVLELGLFGLLCWMGR